MRGPVTDPPSHLPGLDGLRGLAVAAVVLFHLDRLPGGYLGVDAFFVLSGWLITTRLLAEAAQSATGRVDLRRFWAARVRRLVPASLVVLLTVPLVWRAAGIEVPSLERDVLWALGWASNWGTIIGDGDYWARFGEQSPLTHFWSLAVEEQLYLIWPLVVVVVLRFAARSRHLAVAASAAVLAIASIAYMVLTFDPGDPSATYMDTIARAHSILLGASVAALMASPRTAVAARSAAIGLLAPASAGVIAFIATADAGTAWHFRGGFPAFALLAVVIVVAAGAGAAPWLFAAPALRWLGDRGYGIYLWHWPAIVLLSPERTGLDGLALDGIRVSVALTLAAASYAMVEVPIRAGRWPRGALPAAAATALAAVVVVIAATSVPATRVPTAASEVALPPLPEALHAVRPLSSLPAEPPALAGLVPEAATARTTPARPVRVLVVGDSTGVHLAAAVIAHATDHPDQLQAGSAAHVGCGLTAAADGRRHAFTTPAGEQSTIDLSACVQVWQQAVERVAAEAIDIVLVQVGPWDGTDILLPGGEVTSVAEPEGRRLVVQAYRRFVHEAEAAGARVLWVTPPDLHLAWAGIDSPLDDPRRWRALRGVVDSLGVEQLDLPGWLRAYGADGPAGREDGVHLVPAVNAAFVEQVVVPGLRRELLPSGEGQIPSMDALSAAATPGANRYAPDA